MRVVINGAAEELPADATVASALALTGAPSGGRGVAVAVDGEVVPRGQWEKVALREGQRIEVLQAVGGG